MTNILIMSDNHGRREAVTHIKERHSVQAMIHCGDSELDEDAEELAGFIKVAGNCDMDARFPNESVQDIASETFLVTHGHHHRVKSTLLPLTYRAEETDADIVCFGHTHIAGAEKINERIYINPGSIYHPKGKYGKTYAIITLHNNEQVEVNFYTLSGEPIEELRLHTIRKNIE